MSTSEADDGVELAAKGEVAVLSVDSAGKEEGGRASQLEVAVEFLGAEKGIGTARRRFSRDRVTFNTVGRDAIFLDPVIQVLAVEEVDPFTGRGEGSPVAVIYVL